MAEVAMAEWQARRRPSRKNGNGGQSKSMPAGMTPDLLTEMRVITSRWLPRFLLRRSLRADMLQRHPVMLFKIDPELRRSAQRLA